MEKETVMKETTKLMLGLGMPVHLRGYRYIREAIVLTVLDAELVTSVTKLLYPDVAKEFDTTSAKVERAIRGTIEVSWERGNPEILDDFFWPEAQKCKRPTNSEYIAVVADRIRLSLRESTEV